jgi:hypothetical protein
MIKTSIAPMSIESTGPAISSWRHRRRSAEQRCPAARKADVTVIHHLLRQRRRVHDHGIEAAGLGDERDDGPIRLRQRSV